VRGIRAYRDVMQSHRRPVHTARPLFQAALGYVRNHPLHRITVDRGAYRHRRQLRRSIIRWNRHPELPLFGVDPQTRTQLLQDFTQPLVIHNSQNVETLHNVIGTDASPDDDPMRPR
jgi:hypothetical protein